MKYKLSYSTQFKRDVKLASKQHKNIDLLFDVIEMIANGSTLDAKYKDHPLRGNYCGCRECHIETDFILIYEIQEELLVARLIRIGSHSDLFK